MTFLQPKIPAHHKIIKSIEDFLKDAEGASLPDLGSGRLEFQIYKAALVTDTALSRLEEVIEESKQKSAAKMPVTCSKGCDACCHQPVSGTLYEGVLIALYLDANPESKQQFLDKYNGWRNSIGDIREYERLMMLGTLAKVGGQSDAAASFISKAVSTYNQDKNIPCPFLTEHSCSVYSARPTVCRNLLSVDDPAICGTGEKSKQLVAYDINYLSNNKFIEIFWHLSQSLGFNVLISALIPITVYEFLGNRSEYIEFVRERNNRR